MSVTFFLLALLSHENFAFIAGSGMKSIFTGIDSSSHTAASSAQVIYSFMSFFKNLFIYFIVIANIFFYKAIAWRLLSRIPYSVSVIPVPLPDSGFRIPSFSAAGIRQQIKGENRHENRHSSFISSKPQEAT